MTSPLERPPATCPIAFKEWMGVCAALERGDQTILLRKGGIAEGPGGFAPEHPAFWLYPTAVHEAEQGLKPQARRAEDGPGRITADEVVLRSLVVVGRVDFLGDRSRLDALEDWHVWTPETVAKRFDYRRPGLWLLTVRVFLAEPPAAIRVTPEHAGCKTWVPLASAPEARAFVPVLDDEVFLDRLRRIEAIVSPGPSPS